mmetsp:Transcript_19135/g.39851  ORF Transcript_19135/g.39851 Transcript_19135/m.39851 type:complete len:200 (+) Transcript_19135:156-755(+)
METPVKTGHSALQHVSLLYAKLQEDGNRKENEYKTRIMELVREKDKVEAKNCDLLHTVAFLQSSSTTKGLSEIDEWKHLVTSLQEDRERMRAELEKQDNGEEVRKLKSRIIELENAIKEESRRSAPLSSPATTSQMVREVNEAQVEPRIGLFMHIINSLKAILLTLFIGFKIIAARQHTKKKTDEEEEICHCSDVAMII